MNPDNEYITPKQVAERVGVSVVTVHNWINGGDLKAIRVGRRKTLIPVDQLDISLKLSPIVHALKTAQSNLRAGLTYALHYSHKLEAAQLLDLALMSTESALKDARRGMFPDTKELRKNLALAAGEDSLIFEDLAAIGKLTCS